MSRIRGVIIIVFITILIYSSHHKRIIVHYHSSRVLREDLLQDLRCHTQGLRAQGKRGEANLVLAMLSRDILRLKKEGLVVSLGRETLSL
jgi:hypothetical protein